MFNDLIAYMKISAPWFSDVSELKLKPKQSFNFTKRKHNQNKKRKKNMLNVSKQAKRKHKRN